MYSATDEKPPRDAVREVPRPLPRSLPLYAPLVATLNPRELGYVRAVAQEIEDTVRANGQTHLYGKTRERDPRAAYRQQCIASAAEMAFAKAVGMYWQAWTSGPDDGGDVGHVNVRFISHSDLHLTVYPKDDDWRVFALVTRPAGAGATFHVTGWLYGMEAKQERYWAATGAEGRSPAFFVPQGELRDPGNLRAVTTTRPLWDISPETEPWYPAGYTGKKG